MAEGPDQTQATEEMRLRSVYAGYRESGANRRWSQANPGYQRLVEARRQAQAEMLKRAGRLPLAGLEILDVGCGFGSELAALIDLGAEPRRLHGLDMLGDRVEQARRDFPGLDFRICDARHLVDADDTFDLLLSFTVFSSILDEPVAREVAAEMARVLRPGGAVLWFDLRYRNPWNPNVRGVGREELRRWFPGFMLDLRPVGLLPPLARRLGPTAPVTFPLLSAVPPLRSHLLGLLRSPA